MNARADAAPIFPLSDQFSCAPVIAVEGVSKTYASGRALCEVSISCRAGEVRALLGENGAGKSTLVKIISGALQA